MKITTVTNFVIIMLMINIPFLIVFGWYDGWDTDAKILFTIASLVISFFGIGLIEDFKP